jgi:hypothetical protein
MYSPEGKQLVNGVGTGRRNLEGIAMLSKYILNTNFRFSSNNLYSTNYKSINWKHYSLVNIQLDSWLINL